MPAAQSAIGLAVFLALAWALSEKRALVAWRTVAAGLALQVLMAVLLLKLPLAKQIFLALNDAMLALDNASRAGTSFVFGYLGGGPLPFTETAPGASFVLAFRALPLVLVISALSALLFHWRVLPIVVEGFARLLERVTGIGGAVGVSTAANVFVGMVEAPLFIRPYLRQLSRGELFMVMTCGMAGIAGTVMVLYASVLGSTVPDALGHILVASLVSAPAAIVIASLMVPAEGARTAGGRIELERADSSMDAITRGTISGVEILIQIVALLIVLVALVTLLNLALGALPDVGGEPISMQRLLGAVMAPLTWLAGVPWSEAQVAGSLMGTKTVLNELLAYIDMGKLSPEALSERSRVIMTYALCGFANFGSLGIMIGGMGAMVPERRAEIVSLGMKSLVSGTLATLATGATVGLIW
ncbi:MAG: nucleoside:proton symporter [Betaproteobacteria bacterium]|nr:MAG: nucleoside:proton symporter [Betaproteobacteria bacterium]